MPAKQVSLRITESYRGRMIGLRNRAKVAAKKTWARVDPDRLDDTFNPGMLVLTTTTLQREAARLSAGYLAAYVSSETGERTKLPPAMALDAGKIWTGSSLTKAFRGAVIGTKIQIADGKSAIEAYKEGGQALVQTAGLAVDDVCREALRTAMDQSADIVGYQRAVKGTCSACMGAADGVETSIELPLSIHPNCQCVSEPVATATKDPMSSDQAQKYLDARQAPFSGRSATVLDEYQGDGAHWVNKLLRGEDITADSGWRLSGRTIEEIEALARDMKKAVEGSPRVGRPLELFRGVSGKPSDFGLLEGNVVTDSAFGSSSVSRMVAIGAGEGPGKNFIMELTIHPDVRGVWMPRAIQGATQAAEQEFVVQSGCRYVVRSSKTVRTVSGREQTILKVVVLPPK